MKLLKRLWPLFAAVAVVVLAIALMQNHMLPRTHGAEGTQSDPHVGTSKYPAPKDASKIPSNPNHPLAPAPVAVIKDPNAVPALSDVNARCQWADPRGNNPPSLQDDGKGAQKFSDMPDTASTNTLKCAVARAKAAGYQVIGNSVKCSEAIVKLLDSSTNTLWSFRPFCMAPSQTSDPTCMVTLIPTDIEGNFLWRDQPDLSRLQNFLADGVRNDPSYAGC